MPSTKGAIARYLTCLQAVNPQRKAGAGVQLIALEVQTRRNLTHYVALRRFVCHNLSCTGEFQTALQEGVGDPGNKKGRARVRPPLTAQTVFRLQLIGESVTDACPEMLKRITPDWSVKK